MNKSIVFRICLFLIVLACALPTVYAYNTHQKAQIETEGEAKGNITFIRTSVASETIKDKYLKVAGKISNSDDGKWIKGGLVDLPTTSTYQIAYYMFTPVAKNENGELYNPNPVIIGDNSLAEDNYGYVDVGDINNLEDDRYVSAKLNPNPGFTLDKCVVNTEEQQVTINKYIIGANGNYVVSETYGTEQNPNRFFRYTVAEMRVIKKVDNNEVYYELQEKIALNNSATAILQKDEPTVYYITPVFYTKGLPTDIPNVDNQSAYADQYFYSYTLNEFFQMKSWASSVRGNDGKGIDSVINQMDNSIEISARVRTEEIIIKYVKLPDRNMVTIGVMGKNTLSAVALSFDAVEIKRYISTPEKGIPQSLNLTDIIKSAVTNDGTKYFNEQNDELIGYTKRNVDSESELLVSKMSALDNMPAGEIPIEQKKIIYEIIVYSRPRKLDATLTVNHETWHQPDSINQPDKWQKMSDYEIPGADVMMEEGNHPSATSDVLYNSSTGINGYYEFQVYPDFNESKLVNLHETYINVPIHERERFNTTSSIDILSLSGAELINTTTQYITLKLTSTNASITVRYKVYRGNSPDIEYNGILKADTISSTSVTCDGILSIPNKDQNIYLGIDNTLLHYVKGITTEAKWINKSKKNLGDEKLNGKDDYNLKYTVKIKGVMEDTNTSNEEDTVTVQVTDCPSMRFHNITQVAIFSISSIEYYNPTKDEYNNNLYDTVGDKILDLNGNISYTQSFNWNKDDITIKIYQPTKFDPYYKIVRSLHYYTASEDWQYPMKLSLLNTTIDFKENLIDIISPYAFSNTNPYARELLDFKYNYTKYDDKFNFETCMSDMINNALGIGRNEYWRKTGIYKPKFKDFTVNLDFSKIYKYTGEEKNSKDANYRLDIYDSSVSFAFLDKNGDKIIDKKDLEIVYTNTNNAYAKYVLDPTQMPKSKLKEIYFEECKFVDLYDEALLMQALGQMFSNLSETAWIKISSLEIYAEYTDAWATVTINDNNITNTSKTVDIIRKKNNLTTTQTFNGLFNGDNIQMRISGLYENGNFFGYNDMDYNIVGRYKGSNHVISTNQLKENLEVKKNDSTPVTYFRQLCAARFAYWATNKQEIRIYNLSAYKKEKGVVTTIATKSKVVVWGYTDKENNNKFVEKERFYVGTLKEEDYIGKSDRCKNATVVFKEPTNENMKEGITIVEELLSTVSTGPDEHYKNNVVTPINNIMDNFSNIFNNKVIKLLEKKYTQLSKEVKVESLKTICNGDLNKLQKLVNATMINSENVFNNVYGLDKLAEKVAVLNDKAVAEYVTDENSIIYRSEICGYINNANLPKMTDKIFVDIDKMFMKNLNNANYQYSDTYGKIYLDDVLIYIINNFDVYYNTNIYNDCKNLCNGVEKGNQEKYINGLLAKIKYLADVKSNTVSAEDKQKYNTYLADMSYDKIYDFASKKSSPNIHDYLISTSSIRDDLKEIVGSNATLKAIVDGFDAYLTEYGTSNTNLIYNYYEALTDNVIKDDNLNTSLMHVFMQNSNNAIANFDIHFDAYQAYYYYWIQKDDESSVPGEYSDEVSPAYVGVKGGKGFLTARGTLSSSRLAVDQNTYTGYSGKDKWSDSRQNDNNNNILGNRSKFSNFTVLAKSNTSLVKSLISYTENGIRQFAAKVSYKVSKLLNETSTGIHTDNVFDGTSASSWNGGTKVKYDTKDIDVHKYGKSSPVEVEEKENYYVITLKNNTYTSLKTLKDKTIYALDTDEDYTDVKDSILSEIKVTFKEVSTIEELKTKLINGEIYAILLSDFQYGMIYDEARTFENSTRKIFTATHSKLKLLSSNSIPINVYTPIYVLPEVTTSLVKTENQKIPASKFEMTFSQTIKDGTSKYYNVSTEDSTRDVYYVRFNFDVYDVKYTSALDINKIIDLNGTIKKETWIGPINSAGIISGAVSGLGRKF